MTSSLAANSVQVMYEEDIVKLWDLYDESRVFLYSNEDAFAEELSYNPTKFFDTISYV